MVSSFYFLHFNQLSLVMKGWSLSSLAMPWQMVLCYTREALSNCGNGWQFCCLQVIVWTPVVGLGIQPLLHTTLLQDSLWRLQGYVSPEINLVWLYSSVRKFTVYVPCYIQFIYNLVWKKLCICFVGVLLELFSVKSFKFVLITKIMHLGWA